MLNYSIVLNITFIDLTYLTYKKFASVFDIINHITINRNYTDNENYKKKYD